jgi:two-component system response regulator
MKRKKILLVEDNPDEEDILSSYRLGANSYVRKPVEFHQFVEAVRQLGLYWLIINETPAHKA